VVCGTVVATGVISGSSILLIRHSATHYIRRALTPLRVSVFLQYVVAFVVLLRPARDDIGESVREYVCTWATSAQNVKTLVLRVRASGTHWRRYSDAHFDENEVSRDGRSCTASPPP